MPTRIMHFCIANEILKRVDLNRDMLILGNLAPDAHSKTLEDKFITHFQIENDSRSIDYPFFDLDSFINKYMTKEFDNFVLGYYCHLFTDNMWFKSIYSEYLCCDNEAEKEHRIAMCKKDYGTLNRVLINQFHLKRERIDVPKLIAVEEVKPENLLQLTNDFYSDFRLTFYRGKLRILNIEFVLNFIHDSTEICLNEIEKFIKI